MVARLDPPPELLTVVVVALIVVDPNTVAGVVVAGVVGVAGQAHRGAVELDHAKSALHLMQE